jgi:hypothetical protein
MARFADCTGREWTLRLTVGLLDDVRDQLGIDLWKVTTDAAAAVEPLYTDVRKLVGLLWLLVEREAAKAGVSPEEFGRALDAEALDASAEALFEALLRFFQRRARGARPEEPTTPGPSTPSDSPTSSPASAGLTPGP